MQFKRGRGILIRMALNKVFHITIKVFKKILFLLYKLGNFLIKELAIIIEVWLIGRKIHLRIYMPILRGRL